MTGWRVVSLAERLESPPVDDGLTKEERERARAELRRMPPEQVERSAKARAENPTFARNWRPLRRALGISAFGVAANVEEAGGLLIIPHDEAEHGHEEVYLVVRGRARFTLDGEDVELGAGELVYVAPGVVRGAVALETPTQLFMVGGLPGTYTSPIWAPDWRPPAA